ncbi:purine-nucleoside phosphorylase [Algoriphagus sp. NF]|jgi:purine-nucleoside phosphorylase|uniref:Purine nucleoside phosphorylase n=2 Tax=Algoriphagus TaxID=246875 RepID=A0ABS7N4E5_9BACT|nr:MULTISPECIES: purine-nucleoside phosphorylase [Algoriphagus]MBY5951194.1 purine-nucleoside phosphorylase [Algoriphagus marincola]MDE0559342.1 purine-nucleoside phosphorylase [Algoriphagus sp. NF]TDK46125.1 purine-nucleoside phosphorylase [Algoriphagus aquimaris]
MNYLTQIHEAARFLKNLCPDPVENLIILGTGLGKLGDQIDISLEIDYSDIPHFPISTVETHSGKLLIGTLAGKPVIAMRGRFHYYEGYSMQQLTFPVRVMKHLGVKRLFVSNASGGLNPDQAVGDVMILTDHINLLPDNPLRGENPPEFGPRFPDMSDAYSSRLVEMALEIAKENGFKIHTGVYAAVSGPNLETPAEYRFIRIIGADAVGMSTVPEVIVARQSNMEVFGISAITDLGVPGKIHKITLDDVVAAAAKAEPILSKILLELIKRV